MGKRTIMACGIILTAVFLAGDFVLAEEIKLTTLVPQTTVLRASKGFIGDLYATQSDASLNAGRLSIAGEDSGIGINAFDSELPSQDYPLYIKTYNMANTSIGLYSSLQGQALDISPQGITQSGPFMYGNFRLKSAKRMNLEIGDSASSSVIISITTNSAYTASYTYLQATTTYVTGALQVQGNITYYAGLTYGSDIRLKKNIDTLSEGALEKLTKLRGVTFEWRRGEIEDIELPEGRQIGLIAQELEKEFPELVSTADNGYKAISYDKLTVVLLEGIKELKAKNDLLEKRIAALEARGK
ncbi:MAG: tail fiber domain-containing protein [Candidatus Omnitrophica bacterium]|nr:tail fiber domain-containing protein [Candidatus Omnitrophota bacterium]